MLCCIFLSFCHFIFLSFVFSSSSREKSRLFQSVYMYLRCRFVWQKQHRLLCVCFCRTVMCFKWSLVLRKRKTKRQKRGILIIIRCFDAMPIIKSKRRGRGRGRSHACVVCVECECVCVCVVVFGGSKKDSKLALKRTSLFSFSTRRALLSTSLLRLCISTTP